MTAQRRHRCGKEVGVRLAARAAYVLRSNSNSADTATKASPELYPHQWSWDAAFNAIGLASVDLPRARTELDSLFAGQWLSGMVPHIVFDPSAGGYIPGPDRWACARVSPDAPAGVLTSGICQPPVHAIAVARLWEHAEALGPDERVRTLVWIRALYPKLLAWHDYLAQQRRHRETGLIEIFHGWESGTDNSPRWDIPYSRVQVGDDLPPYVRRDTGLVAEPSQRPTDEDYDRYLWLVEEAKRAGYDTARLRPTASFRAGDVLFTAIFASADESLARIADDLGEPQAAVLRGRAAQSRGTVLRCCDPETGLAADVDLRTGEWLRTETIAGFAPLVAGGAPPHLRHRLVEQLLGPRWAGHPRLRWPLPPSTSPFSPAFDRRSYWRGPVWPVMTWLLTLALRREGEIAAAEKLTAAGLDQLGDGTFAEYYDPFSGEPCGSLCQSWTASAALDWLLADPDVPVQAE